ncbi:MAG: AAA family ATPase [Oscillospiraceae bacterium]|nr:AAA family ATPase [Oscillospiraceae bacterium]
MAMKPIPIGVENFKEIITSDYYYTDKTLLIRDLLDSGAKVSLFTRPRRFGKTLNMSMLRYFFEKTDEDTSYLFDGLKISNAGEKYMSYCGQYPVISISLKSMSKKTFQKNMEVFRALISTEFIKHKGILKSDIFSDVTHESYKEDFINICNKRGEDNIYELSLKFLCDLLYEIYQKKVIILIDEYDVPLQNAWLNGFYDEMVDFIRSLFDVALKTNDSLEFGVLTGCLRISKESIFTGMNNLNVNSISEVQFSEYFGFTDEDVKEMLNFYGLEQYHAIAKQWYDGYHFGMTEMYCPWDIVKYCNDLLHNSAAQPKAYWINTSGNDIVRKFISSATATMKHEIERLMSGQSIKKAVNQELTYRELNDNLDNLWSMLYMTGYLTHSAVLEDDVLELMIPNLEIRKIFRTQIYAWFSAYAAQNKVNLTDFCMTFRNGDAEKAQELFNQYLGKVISIRDTNVEIAKKENFYHGILLGLFSHMDDWAVNSNVESGDGYSDILILIPADEIGIVIEVKYGENEKLEQGCKEALKQIEDRNYVQYLLDEGMTTILKYGVACYKKKSRIIKAEN